VERDLRARLSCEHRQDGARRSPSTCCPAVVRTVTGCSRSTSMREPSFSFFVIVLVLSALRGSFRGATFENEERERGTRTMTAVLILAAFRRDAVAIRRRRSARLNAPLLAVTEFMERAGSNRCGAPSRRGPLRLYLCSRRRLEVALHLCCPSSHKLSCPLRPGIFSARFPCPVCSGGRSRIPLLPASPGWRALSSLRVPILPSGT
jgi:hypothetical protein